MKNWEQILSIMLNPVMVLTVGILTILFNSKSNRKSTSFIKLEKVYHPLFLEIEPYLFKNISPEFTNDFIEKYNEIYEKNSLYVDINLHYDLQEFQYFLRIGSEEWCNKYWFKICNNINNNYDKLCKTTDLPIRSILYRLNKQQYRTKLEMFIMFLRARNAHVFALVYLAALLIAYLYL
ncbi:hypothetical protein KQI18_11620 [Clostridioides mangenotii]|uniref:hypothetical protein n=1 Tax=Metaclostridioides mangenotii TaxID=1540 RepID=UPI001C126663|nr:hypothetical protein [Clostridioides mangenotii]MBU5308425.1 hypothetical protein [Clostridioides mangenotii]